MHCAGVNDEPLLTGERVRVVFEAKDLGNATLIGTQRRLHAPSPLSRPYSSPRPSAEAPTLLDRIYHEPGSHISSPLHLRLGTAAQII